MTLYEKSLNILELPAVLRLLAGKAVCDAAKEQAGQLFPSDNRYEIEARLRETSEAKRLLEEKGSPAFSAIRDISASLGRAKLGGVLNTRELLDIAVVLRSTRSIRAYSGELEAGSSLSGLFSALRPNKYLEERITLSITGEDEIADAASSELASIRRHIRTVHAKIREILQRIIASPTQQKLLQEPIITMRADRYVVPVKAEHKGALPGLVHDISSSGATLFVEPMQVVQANNEIKELTAKERNEIERILAELSAEAAGFEQDLLDNFRILTALDLIFAKAKLSSDLACTEPELSTDGSARLKRARHPLLPKASAVPIDIGIGGEYDTLVITGPNTGGKTVSIKTLGLLAAMAQCGLHIPAAYGSCLPVFKCILADIGDEQSIEQSLSTFSSHMTSIVAILHEAQPDALLLFDELGAGTDPVEGAALAISVIEYARTQGACVATTTHYAELKVYATSTPRVMNASCEFDVETLRPTYRLLMGIPGKSNAFEISRRLGLDDQIIQDAKRRINSESRDFEDVIAQLQQRSQELEKMREETAEQLLQARAETRRVTELRAKLESEREKAAVLARRDANRIVEDARRTAEQVFAELKEMQKHAEKEKDVQKSNAQRADILHRLNDLEAQLGERDKAQETEIKNTRPIRVGDTVELLKYGTRAEVLEVSSDHTLTLQAGILKVTVKDNEVRLLERVKSERKRQLEKSAKELRNVSVSPELDIRGMLSDEGVNVMERYLDNAVLSKLNTVTIIHGKGTGALRSAVQQALRRNSHVKSFRLGKFGEGESGVTVVELK